MTPVTPKLTMKDVSIRKPMMSTMPNDSRRTEMYARMLLRVGLAFTPQNLLSALCICANTVVAPKRSAPTPSIVGSRPASSSRECRTASSTAFAA